MTHAIEWAWSGIRASLLIRRTVMLEVFLAMEAVLWGLWVANPLTDSFASIPEAYTILGLLPEWLVGLVFVGHGTAAAWAIYRTAWRPPLDAGGRPSRRYVHWCRRAALAGAGLWSVVLFSLLATVPTSTATPIYAGLMAASMWVYVRLDWRYGR